MVSTPRKLVGKRRAAAGDGHQQPIEILNIGNLDDQIVVSLSGIGLSPVLDLLAFLEVPVGVSSDGQQTKGCCPDHNPHRGDAETTTTNFYIRGKAGAFVVFVCACDIVFSAVSCGSLY